jgi:hypothetical protein
MGLLFTIAAGLTSWVILGSVSRETHDHILQAQIRDPPPPNLVDQVPVFISHRNRVARLYPPGTGFPFRRLLLLAGLRWPGLTLQALGSLFVASYHSQGYGGPVIPSRHWVPFSSPPTTRRATVARLYPQALGSLFVGSYDSQGYGGGTHTRLHTGYWRGSLSIADFFGDLQYI